jgi:polyhydroxybutyrate depolymerase
MRTLASCAADESRPDDAWRSCCIFARREPRSASRVLSPERSLKPKRAVWTLWLALGSAWLLACHYLRAPSGAAPRLRAGVHGAALREHGLDRKYLLYVPPRLAARPPLLVLLHGSRQTGEELRRVTGYAFDRLADEHGFITAYPDGFGRRWNDCRAKGRYKARRKNIDDVGFLLDLIERLEDQAGIDPARVFLAGYSSGAQLAFRVALEQPARVTGIAAFAANLPSDDNWFCQASGKPVPVMLINGTEDPINPFAGGKVRVFGFRSRGRVRSALASARYFAALAGLERAEHRRLIERSGTQVEEWRWRAQSTPEIVLLGVRGGGHVVPGPHSAFPGVLGEVSRAVDGPREAWGFFARQRPLHAP